MAFYLGESSQHICKMAVLDNKNRLTNLFTQSLLRVAHYACYGR